MYNLCVFLNIDINHSWYVWHLTLTSCFVMAAVLQIAEDACMILSTWLFDNRLGFAHAGDVFSLMENIATVAVPEIHLTDNNGASTTYPSLNRFSWFLSFICLALCNKWWLIVFLMFYCGYCSNDVVCFQCFDAVGWVAGGASGL